MLVSAAKLKPPARQRLIQALGWLSSTTSYSSNPVRFPRLLRSTQPWNPEIAQFTIISYVDITRRVDLVELLEPIAVVGDVGGVAGDRDILIDDAVLGSAGCQAGGEQEHQGEEQGGPHGGQDGEPRTHPGGNHAWQGRRDH